MAVSRILVLLFVFAAPVAMAIKCFVCNSEINAGCENIQVPDKYLVTCAPDKAKAQEPAHPHTEHAPATIQRGIPFAPPDTNFTYCRKTKFNIPVQNNGDGQIGPSERIERSCGYADKEEAAGCKWQTSFGGIQVYTCRCEADRCNSGRSWEMPIISLVVAQVLLLVKHYCF